jgi:exosome complex component RRP46
MGKREADERGGGTAPRDRHLETMIARALKPIVLARAFPRTLVQLTLQVLRTPAAKNPPGPFAHSVRSPPPPPSPPPPLVCKRRWAIVDASHGARRRCR